MGERAQAEVRMLSEETLRGIVSQLPLRTSCRLNWAGVEVHRYRLTTRPAREFSLPYISVFLPHPTEPYSATVTIGGRVLTARVDKNSVSIMPPGMSRVVSDDRDLRQPRDLTAILLDPLHFAPLARAETGVDFPEIVPQFGITDPLIRSIGMVLDSEVASDNPGSRVYAETLVAALAAHIFAKYSKPPVNGMDRTASHWPELRRCVDFIQQNLEKELRLSDIAAIANMSKYHFAKSFRQAFGIPPHQYQVRMRVEKARKLLDDRTMSLEEVASRVGYADKEHFSQQFVKIVGTTPKHYRETS